MEIQKSVIVMNSSTYEEFMERCYEKASKLENPIDYILNTSSIDVVIDEEIPNGISEIWDKDVYEKYKKGR